MPNKFGAQLRASNFLMVLVVALLLGTAIPAHLLAQRSDSTTEKSPVPQSGFVTVNRVKLHYLDWGGCGATLVLLAGFNDTAHIFDEFAPRFTDRFHVLGLTRRGFGDSAKPTMGYDAGTRVEDIRQFLNVLGVSHASLIGHSMAGDELTLFATLYPERVTKLVYLDAIYDRTPEGWKRFLTNPLNRITDPDSRLTLLRRMKMEALDLPDGSNVVVKTMPPPEQWAILVATQKAVFAFRPDYTKVPAPALAFFAISANAHYPSSWLPEDADEKLRAKAEAWWQEKGHELVRSNYEQFRRTIPHGEVVELDDANHYVFMGTSENEVVRKTREFLLK